MHGKESLRAFGPDSLPLTEGVPGCGLTLGDGHTRRDRKKARWARDVFHSVLAMDLKVRGAATGEQLYHRLSWFMLPFSRLEIGQILESARRDGIIVLLDDESDAFGTAVSGEWTLTEEGRKLKRARALALPDLGVEALRGSAGYSTAFSSIKGVLLGAAPYLALIFGPRIAAGTVERWALVITGGAGLGTVLWNGVRGDRKLKAAAESWPRMWDRRRARYEYQMSIARLVFIPIVLVAVYLTIAAGFLLEVEAWLIGTAVAGELFLAWLVYLSGLHDLKRAWDAPDRDLLSWGWTWRLRAQERQEGPIPSVST